MQATIAAPGRVGGMTMASRARPVLQMARVVAPVVRISSSSSSRSGLRRAPLSVVAASRGGVAHPGEEAAQGRDSQQQQPPSQPSPLNAAMLGVPATTMAKGGGGGGSRDMGSGGSLSATVERSKLQFVMPTPPQQAPKLDDSGNGGDNGKRNHNGGGGGDGGDGGDDDDYFGGEGEGDGDGSGGGGGGGDGFFRTALPELYDRLTLAAVLQEWYKTVAELPLFIRRAVEMGLFSSAQLVRFLSMDVRPNMTRAVSRALPSEWARGFVGRLMADPGFVHKLVIEQVVAFSASMVHEWRVRGDAFKQELDLALINSLGLAAAVGATVWVTAPSRAYGAVHKYPWQQMLSSLPSCVFDASGPLRHYTNTARLGGFFATMAQLSAIGALAGGATSAASAAAVKLHQAADPTYEPSVPLAEAGRSSAGLGAFFAVNANTRYQLLGGLDRYLIAHSNFMWTYLGATLCARGLFTAAGEASRPWWQGLSTDTAESHVARARKVKRVRRKVNKSGVVSAAPALTGAERQAQLAAAAAAAAAAGGDSSSSSRASAAALADYAPIAAAAAAGSGVSSSGADGAAAAAEAALAAYQPISADDSLEVAPESSQQAESLRGLGSLEASAHEQLSTAPAVMGGPSALEGLIQQQRQPVEAHQHPQQLHHLPSLSDSTIGAALRDAVTESVGANA